jgi:membrane-associated phospholipid phosphatase
VAGLFFWLARTESWFRDLVPLLLTLIAFREMNWFTPPVHDHHLEQTWIVWDRLLLDHYALRAGIESAGALLPFFLELCYALVYAVAPVALWALFANGRRDHVNQLWLAYLAGTLGAYALFPFFPSEPPRTAFANQDLPTIVTFLRRFNLWIVGHYGIHSSVFPSAHVSSALSAAWGLLVTIPERRWIGWTMAAYGLCVGLATVYGRYHYAVDAAAGIAVSFLGLAAVYLNRRGA